MLNILKLPCGNHYTFLYYISHNNFSSHRTRDSSLIDFKFIHAYFLVGNQFLHFYFEKLHDIEKILILNECTYEYEIFAYEYIFLHALGIIKGSERNYRK